MIHVFSFSLNAKPFQDYSYGWGATFAPKTYLNLVFNLFIEINPSSNLFNPFPITVLADFFNPFDVLLDARIYPGSVMLTTT